MDEKERITSPSMGSNELGEETSEDVHTGVSAGSDTQLFLTALGGKKHKKHKHNNEEMKKNEKNESGFLKEDQMEE